MIKDNTSDSKVCLELKDGHVFQGNLFGFSKSVAGEVVFNTAMTGYPESITDPSYKGQILVLTYPLIGNYGVPDNIMENNLSRFYESEQIQVSGLIISDYSAEHHHWNARKSLSDWLTEHQIPGIYGIDTRALTKILRENGSMPGKIISENKEVDFYDPNEDNLVSQVSTKEKIVYGNGRFRILLVDCGVKNNIIRHLLKRDTTVIRVPWDYDFTKEEYDGLFLTNGPGDPKKCDASIRHLKAAFEQNRPVFGICLGNQLMALASGADTYKLKYGHRSHNQPVRLNNSTKCFITSQNHGFAVDERSLKGDWETLFYNINDGTNEGLKHKTKPFFSVQFHPEASSGPTDTDFLFDDFLRLIKGR
jgi:carbamoyl-phosphate synthase small subunit